MPSSDYVLLLQSFTHSVICLVRDITGRDGGGVASGSGHSGSKNADAGSHLEGSKASAA